MSAELEEREAKGLAGFKIKRNGDRIEITIKMPDDQSIKHLDLSIPTEAAVYLASRLIAAAAS